MQCGALDVLGQGLLLGDAVSAHDARHRLRLVQALLLHQELQRSEPTAARRHLEHPGLVAFGIQYRPHVQALQEGSPGDVFCKLLDGDAGLDPAYVGLAQHQLVEGDVARRTESNFGSRHVDVLHDGAAESLSLDLQPVADHSRLPLTLPAPLPSWNRNHRC